MSDSREDADDIGLRVCVHITITNEEDDSGRLTHHSITFETDLGGRSLDEIHEIARTVAEATFWHEFTVSLGIVVSFIRQVHAQRS